MKKCIRILAPTFLIVMVLAFSACSSDSSRNVEGEWVLTDSSWSVLRGSRMDFVSDGSAMWQLWDDDDDWREYPARWRVEGNYFIFYIPDDNEHEYDKYILSLDGYTMTLVGYTNPDYYHVYTRPHAVQIESTAVEYKLDEMIISLLNDIGWIAPTTVRVLDAARLDVSLREDENPFRLPSTTIVLTVQSQNRGGGLTTTIVTSRLSFGGEYAWSTVDSFPGFPRYRTDLDVARLNGVIVGHWESLGVN